VEDRLARERAKYSDYDELKTKAARADQLEADLGTDAEKAAKKAADDARAEVTRESVPRVVRAEFKAEAKGIISDDQLKALLEDLDLSKYVDDKGEPDVEKIQKKVAAFAPSGGSGGGSGAPPRQLGQGQQPPVVAKPGDQGRAMAEKRFGSRKPE